MSFLKSHGIQRLLCAAAALFFRKAQIFRAEHDIRQNVCLEELMLRILEDQSYMRS